MNKSLMAAGALSVALIAAAPAAQADSDDFGSAALGFVLGTMVGPPAVVYTAPPTVIYTPPPRYVAPPPDYYGGYAPPRVYYYYRYRGDDHQYWRHERHERHWGDDDDDR